jgi:uncharacterized protein (TIGR02646 family)
MRYIDLEDLRPRLGAHQANLADAQLEVLSEADPAKRRVLISRRRNRWVAMRPLLAALSYEKCWYLECRNPGTDDDVDHYRPKGAVAEEDDHPGYYWLAFDWHNLRLSCHRANRPRTNADTGLTGGKSDSFPLDDPATRARAPEDRIDLETALLLDPTNPADPPILWFKPNGEVDVSPMLAGNPLAEAKFNASVHALQLNWPTIVDERNIVYNTVERLVERGSRDAPAAYDGFASAPPSFLDTVRDLVSMTKAEADYSTAARHYIESFRHVWWVDQIVLRVAR